MLFRSFDWRDGTKDHPHPGQPNCRLANTSSELKYSGYGYTAFVPDYVEHKNSYCGAISCTDDHCMGGIHYGNETEAACRSLCDAASCECFDWRDGTKAHPHPKQPNCRLTNKSSEFKDSGYGYTAFVSTSAPPAPSAGAWINYGCRDNFAKLPFCDTSKSLEARLDALVASMTTAEKASQLVKLT